MMFDSDTGSVYGPTPIGPEPEALAEEDRGERFEAVVGRLRVLVSRIRAIPKILFWALWASIASSLALGWVWFLRHDPAWLKALAIPWLALAAAPQLGLWLLAKSLQDIVLLPVRIVALKSSLGQQGATLLGRRLAEDEGPPGGVIRRVRAAMSLQGDLATVVGTRVVVQRLSGRLAMLIGPISIALNAAIILVALLHAIAFVF